MYLSHYRLETRPFKTTPDPRFLWPGPHVRRTLSDLRSQLLTGKGFLLLTGEVGTGKTTLVNALASRLSDRIHFVRVTDPALQALDLFNYLGAALDFGETFESERAFYDRLAIRAAEAEWGEKKIVIVMDEAHRVNPRLLEEMWGGKGMDGVTRHRVMALLVGHDEFRELMQDRSNPFLRERISVARTLRPLAENETAAYIRFQMRVAGSAKPYFSEEAMRTVHALSKGYPRRINIICDLALVVGFVTGRRTITPELVRACDTESGFPETGLAETLGNILSHPHHSGRALPQPRQPATCS